uniref:Uncharacterized protein n=1 Tax=Setaria italica TaxID=4555 RepID=K3YFU2_SETIT
MLGRTRTSSSTGFLKLATWCRLTNLILRSE